MSNRTQTVKVDFGRQSCDLNESVGAAAETVGALALYLDFINLFMYLLRFIGQRREWLPTSLRALYWGQAKQPVPFVLQTRPHTRERSTYRLALHYCFAA